MGGKPPKWTCKEPDEITQATLNVHVVYVASPSTSDPYVPLLLPHERLIRSWHPLATAAIYTSLDTLLDKHRGLMHASFQSRSYVLTDYPKTNLSTMYFALNINPGAGKNLGKGKVRQ